MIRVILHVTPASYATMTYFDKKGRPPTHEEHAHLVTLNGKDAVMSFASIFDKKFSFQKYNSKII